MKGVVEELEGQKGQTAETINNQVEMLGETVGINGIESYDTPNGKMVDVDTVQDGADIQYLVGEDGVIEAVGNYRDGEQVDMEIHGDTIEKFIYETVDNVDNYPTPTQPKQATGSYEEILQG